MRSKASLFTPSHSGDSRFRYSQDLIDVDWVGGGGEGGKFSYVLAGSDRGVKKLESPTGGGWGGAK